LGNQYVASSPFFLFKRIKTQHVPFSHRRHSCPGNIPSARALAFLSPLHFSLLRAYRALIAPSNMRSPSAPTTPSRPTLRHQHRSLSHTSCMHMHALDYACPRLHPSPFPVSSHPPPSHAVHSPHMRHSITLQMIYCVTRSYIRKTLVKLCC